MALARRASVGRFRLLNDPHADKPVELLLQLIGIQAGESFAGDLSNFRVGAGKDGSECAAINTKPERIRYSCIGRSIGSPRCTC